MAESGTNQSVEKAAGVLSTFLPGGPLRTADVAKRADLSQSTASRMLATLESVDLVERDGLGMYRLGPALVTLGAAVLNNHPVHRAARQRAQNLAADLRLGANVAERRGDTLFYLCNFEGRDAPRPFMLAGQHNPLHSTGLGKCLLAHTTPEQRRELLGDELPRFTERTVADHDALDEEMATLRARGYTMEIEELALGRACIAAPILDQHGEVAAALSVSGPLSALDLANRQQALADIVVETADAISLDLGYVGPQHAPSRATSR
ncbi:IclR family transcriptional regulator [Actinophytocola xinjiangensis]|uniref:IclR family transcriptional regulator n=1 Tax=Actinophytocola xinjiangensis TaxID=485602 RepID=A0A7Z1AVI7_9PSEU|nr:IclR family transcriptional regulator [Actinophytocola xinjiangensis]OLF06803.1 IclR family transcriptional regulator [Actinophytocola xinjiangensis]